MNSLLTSHAEQTQTTQLATHSWISQCLPSWTERQTEKNKEVAGKYQRTSKEPTPPPRMKQHMASKSALETVEHLHYNSPIILCANTCTNRQTNTFTFTQLLQQNSQNISPLNSKSSLLQYQQSCSILQPKESKIKEKSMARTPLTMTNFSPNVANISQEHELVS